MKNEKLNFEQLKEKEKTLREGTHEHFEIQGILADMLFILLEMPKWKIWAWFPIARYVELIGREHKICCEIELD